LNIANHCRPICYTIIGEVPAVNVRSKSICLARIAYYISQIIVGTISPYMISELSRCRV
jgi:MFS transporter, SP family, general alpha glucoside:H+ symporter